MNKNIPKHHVSVKFASCHFHTELLFPLSIGFFLLCVGILLSMPSQASSLTDNMRFTVDASHRSTRLSIQNQSTAMHALGFDMHKVFTGNNHNIGTLLLQGYLTRIDDHPAPPGIFDSGDDTKFIYRIFNFNYTGLDGDSPNIRIGHYEVAYGLEHAIDTNGTLRQYQQGQNLGIKADWGASLNKQHEMFEYEVGYSSGGNQDVSTNNGSYVYSTRIGTPRDDNSVYGVSLYKSRLGTVNRERLGLDTRQYFGRHGIFAELSFGENNDLDVRNALVEWNIANNRESLLYYTQFSYLSNDLISGTSDEALQGILGIQYTPDTHWDISAQYGRNLSVMGTAKHQTLFGVQLRYRY
jgi:hypothetical protein